MENKLPQLDSFLFEAFSRCMEEQYVYLGDLSENSWRWSPSAVSYFGLPGEYMRELPALWVRLVHPDDREQVVELFHRLFDGKTEEYRCEYRLKNADGEYIWVLSTGCLVWEEHQKHPFCVGVLTNLGQKDRIDPITGLNSSHAFQNAMASAREEPGGEGGLLLFSIDKFLRITDTHQVSFEEQLLRGYARELQQLAPPDCQFFHIDSGKFAAIYRGAGAVELDTLFQRISGLGNRGFAVEGQRVSFSVTGGAVRYPSDEVSQSKWYSCLEYALESAGTSQKEGLTFFTPALHQIEMEKFRLQEKLQDSVWNGFQGFSLSYQPVVSASNEQELVGAEALLRWTDSDFPGIGPTEFVPILEETGTIKQVGRWVLTTAMEQVKSWLTAKPDMKLSVNISYLQFKDNSFRDFVLREARRLEFPKGQLILELTESCNVVNPAELRQELNFFREAGIQIALDDFGTGYASLSVLRDLCADWIKVDHTFVSQITDSDFDQAMTEYLIGLCNKLGLCVCVEGIETEAIEQVIQNYHPTLLQGYYYSKPIQKDAFERQFICA